MCEVTVPAKSAPESSITFDVPSEVGVIIRRAAAAVRLDVVDLPGGGFRVELRDSINAYDLGQACVTDPAWAGVFLRRGAEAVVVPRCTYGRCRSDVGVGTPVDLGMCWVHTEQWRRARLKDIKKFRNQLRLRARERGLTPQVETLYLEEELDARIGRLDEERRRAG